MFQFRRFPTHAYLIQHVLTGSSPAGLPHSEIHGSMRMCRSPWLIAACHVLHRLLMPRHPPCALLRLTSTAAASAAARSAQNSCQELCKLHLQKFKIVAFVTQLTLNNFHNLTFFLSLRFFLFLLLFSSQGANGSRLNAPSELNNVAILTKKT